MFGLRLKLLVSLGALLVILVTVTILANSVLTNYSDRIQDLFRNDFNSAVACQTMKERVEEIDEQALRRVWGDVSADLNSTMPMRRDFDDQLSKQSAIADLPGERQATDELSIAWNRYQLSLPYVFDPDRSDADRRNAYVISVWRLSPVVRDAAQKIVDMNMSSMISGHGAARQMGGAAKVTMQTLMFAGAFVAILVVGLSGTLVLRPLRQLTLSARAIAAGNMDLSVPVRSRDELGELASAFNDMAAQLREFKRIDHERLIRTQRTTQLAIDGLPDAVVVIDPQGKIELTNQTAKRLFALNPDLNVSELPTTWLADLHRRALTEQTPHHPAGYEGAIKVQGDGQEFHFLPKTFPILDEQHNLIGALVELADVTDLRQLDDMKNKLLSMVSHELKTPLTSMRMIMHLIAEERIGPLNEKQRDLLTAAREDSDRLHQIVENLMDMGRIESGAALMEIRPTDAGELLIRAVDASRPNFVSRNIELKLDAPAHTPAVMADPARIGHVLNNLLSNALKYTDECGQVVVSVGDDAGGWVQFSVTDTGRGIPRQYISRVFEKFFRVPGQSGESGTGLGLAIVKDIIEAHGGRIWVESREGRGASFCFVLPRATRAFQEVSHDAAQTQLA